MTPELKTLIGEVEFDCSAARRGWTHHGPDEWDDNVDVFEYGARYQFNLMLKEIKLRDALLAKAIQQRDFLIKDIDVFDLVIKAANQELADIVKRMRSGE